MTQKRVVILGVSGFIGKHLSEHFKNSGIDTIGFSSSQIDLSNPEAIPRLSEIVQKEDVLIFASCITRDKGKDDLPTLMKNLRMAEAVGIFLEKQPCSHVIYISSDAVYRDDLSLIREESEKKPGGLYGITHVAREKMIEYSASKAGVPLMIVRPCAVYGKGDTHDSYGPNRFLRTAIANNKIILFGEGEEKRDHISVGDVCRLIELCVKRQSTGELNLATGQSLTFMQVAQTIAKHLKKLIIIEGTPRKSPITYRSFDVARLLKTFPSFGFTPLAEGLSKEYFL